MLTLNRLELLLWKNFKLKIRHPWILLLEMGIPCMFSIILVIIRLVVTVDRVPNPTIFSPNSIKNVELFSKTVLYAPKTPKTDQIMKILQEITNIDIKVKDFENEEKLLDYYTKTESNYICCGVIFNSIEFDEEFSFKLRFPFIPKALNQEFSFGKINEFTWETSRNFPIFQKPGPRSPKANLGGPPGYYQNGFLFLQHYLCRAFAYHKNRSSTEFYDRIERFNIQRFPYPPYNNDQFLFSLQFMFPIIMMISFIYPFVNLTKNIVLEKELRLKEAMKIMYLKDWMHWSSWFIDSFMWNIISVIIITMLFCTQFKSDFGIINKSNPLLVFIFFLSYIISSITFCFFLSTFFNNANIAGIAAGAVYFIMFLPYFQVNANYHELSYGVKTAISLIFNTNMALGCMMISIWEGNHVGLQWSNLMEAASLDDNLTFLNILVMFVIDSIIYLLAALYISNVFPGRYGIPRKWYYFVQPSYWFTIKSKKKLKEFESIKRNILNPRTGIQLFNLSKSYNHGKIKALQDLNLSLNKNEITVLLGHNGAGKTTLMSILCGMIPPSSGSIYMNGYHLENNIDEIRKSLGVCPQFDILFNHLTVEEHLWFYCKLKNVPDNKIKDQIDRMIKLLNFVDKRHNQAHTLSGGMKRKLSIGIALIGDSKIVLIDEATSGMDVSARRFIWDLLIQEKQQRVILFSTHFMEEADVIGDKIAIIENGQLKCFGSPIELKKNYGLGYLLTFAVKEESVNVKTLIDLIKSYINHTKVLTSIGREVTFSLPESESHKFEKMFYIIEQNIEKLGIINFGISVTTLEEVFLRVGDFSQQGTKQSNSFFEQNKFLGSGSEQSVIEKIKQNSLKLNHGVAHHVQVYYSIFAKKILFIYRNLFLLIAQFILPGVLLAASIAINSNQMNKIIYSPPLNINLDVFHKIQATVFRDQNQQTVQLSNLYRSTISNVTKIAIVDEIIRDKPDDYAIKYLIEYGSKYEDRFNMYYLLSVIFKMEQNRMTIIGLYNNQAYHASSISISYIDRTILKHILQNDRFELSIWNEPFPRKRNDNPGVVSFDSTLQIQLSNNILFSESFLLASFIILLVKEKSINFKHIQRISGLNMFQYWTGNFIIDYVIYLLSSLSLCAIIYLLDVDTFSTIEQQIFLLIVFIVHGIASLPMVYLLSLYFRDAATAYVRLSLYLLILGTTTLLVVIFLEIPQLNLGQLSNTLDYIFTIILPIYNLVFSIFTLSENYIAIDLCLSNITLFNNQSYKVQYLCDVAFDILQELKICCKGKCGNSCLKFDESRFAWEKPGIGFNIIVFIFQAILAWTILALIESKFIDKLLNFSSKTKLQQKNSNIRNNFRDSDVEAEEDRLRRRNHFTLFRTDSMIVQNVRKNYGNFPAVCNISFGVKRGECFGILGENGAGKTTLFKMITGDETITSGNIVINGHDVQKEMHYKDIGYCPQFDGLIDHLTGRETLRMISRIRGIQENFIDNQIDALSELLYFQKHIDHLVGSYSGGTKRKLSFAISIIGNPLIIFLDEPTTGVDPVSRRCLWNAIYLIRSAGSSLVLTSHSMEECEALCNRLMIMVHGKITCLGSPMHLKQKYGAGYIIQIKLKIVGSELLNELSQKLHRFMQTNFDECFLDATHNNLIVYKIKTNKIKLSFLFGQIEKSKHLLSIEDYSIYQTSLEMIFLSFVRKYKEKL